MVTQGRAPTRASAGRRGRRPLRFAREWAAAGACPSSGPAGPPSPEGEGKGCRGGIHPSRGRAAAEGRGGVGAPALRMGGYGNAVGFTWAPVSGPPRGRGRACPARGVTRTPVNGSVRRGGVLTPPRVLTAAGVSASGNPGKAVGGRFRGASGTPPPTVCPGKGDSGSLPLIRPCGATFPHGGRQGLYGGRGRLPLPRQLVLGAELEGQAVVPAV